MASLPKDLRKVLEKASKRARRVGEAGALRTLESLAVHHYESWKHLDAAQQSLRNRLRAHGRQVGDVRDLQKKTQSINHLAAECAYEQWHRMLFARFLAENNLLIDPETKARVDLDLCRDLAEERGMDWVELASSFAVRMLPQIFRAGDPVLEVTLPPETRQELEQILEELPRETFLADDSLGWVYQFWQAERKDAINKSEVKIGADELSPVTQLFTEDYMVLFLLHNTLGAWWAGKMLAENPNLATGAADEQQLRDACAVGEIEWTYLRFIREDAGPWRSAAGTFDGWPRQAREITLLDPCMGSGHFLVFALPILAAMRAKEEPLTKAEATLAVLRDNLYGLELDPRCTQIAAFNLALATWKAIGYQSEMPRLRLACSGLSISANEKEWGDLAGADSLWSGTMAQMHALFRQAPVFGSLIDPKRIFGNLFESTFEKVRPALRNALAAEHANVDEGELAISAQGLLDAAELLMSRFTLVATNVPYLGIRKQRRELTDFAREYHEDARHELATMFMERCLTFCKRESTTAVVSQQSWLSIGSYEGLRESLLKTTKWNLVARLGPGAFEEISGEVVNIGFFVLTQRPPLIGDTFAALDVTFAKSPALKAFHCASAPVVAVLQLAQSDNPDSRIVFEPASTGSKVNAFARSLAGIQNGDSPMYLRYFWEVPMAGETWSFQRTSPSSTRTTGGMNTLIYYDTHEGHLRAPSKWRREALHDSDQRGKPFWGKRGVLIARMGNLPASLYLGELYDQACAAIVPENNDVLPALWAFCSSDEFAKEVRKLDRKVNVTSATLTKVPFDLPRWRRVAAEAFPKGLPAATSVDPTEWIFPGAFSASSSNNLEVAVARLLGYRWPRQTGSGFPDCPALQLDGLESHTDPDGIVMLPPVGGEASAADSLRELLATAYGADWCPDRVESLLREANFAGRSLEDWLRDGFFEQHCALFHQTPFIWHIWDGLKDGFHVLVNYHKLAAPNGEGRSTLEKLIHTTLGRDWIERRRHDEKSGVQGAQEKVAAAEHLRRELTRILEGEPPYDLFVRWKPLHEQSIGWEPDINDGVRLNIRPFMTAKTFNGKSIFRAAPKSMKWAKDRGKEPVRAKEDYPWFWSWDGQTEDFPGGTAFDRNRWNDLHYTRAYKQAARQRAAERKKGVFDATA
jgi:hypothetical protein